MKIGNENSRVKADFPFFSSITTGRFPPPSPAPPSAIVAPYLHVQAPAHCFASVGQQPRKTLNTAQKRRT